MHLLLLLYLMSPWAGYSAALKIWPEMVTVAEGEDAPLNCSLASGQRIDKFDWKKESGLEGEKQVFLYDGGVYYGKGLGGQSDQFKGRIVFFQEELESGNASIVIENTRLEDNGTYTCVLLKPHNQEFNIRLNVVGVLKIRNSTGAARAPYIHTIHDQITWRLLECRAEGVPKPQMEWRNSAGKIHYVQEVIDPEMKNKVILQINVSRTDNYTCVVTQRDIFHHRNTTLGVSIPESVSVSEGDDALLPCSLDSKENIESFKFSWRKDDKEIFFYDRGQVTEHEQFTQRLTLFLHELKSGNASIKILDTQKSDDGHYSCHFPNNTKSHVILQVVENNPNPGALTGWIVAGLLGSVLLVLIIALILRYFCKSVNKRNRADQLKHESICLNGSSRPI